MKRHSDQQTPGPSKIVCRDRDSSTEMKSEGQEMICTLRDRTEKGENTPDLQRELLEKSRGKRKREQEDTKLYTEFKEELVRFYQNNESTIPASPLVEDHAVPLTELYVQPPMSAFIKPNAFGQGHKSPEKTTVSSYRKLLFYDSNVPYKHIYVEANAGYGKTSFTQNIAMTWSQPDMKNKKTVSEFVDLDTLPWFDLRFLNKQTVSKFVDVDTLQRFDLLFLLHLRDFQEEDMCLLDDLIIKFVAQSLPDPERFSEKFIKSMLRTRPCLVLCDGLDEWTHPSGKCVGKPGIPHNNYGENCTVLTTTRPWKISTIGLTPNHIDQHVEITQLDEATSKELKSNAVKLLSKNSGEKERDLTDFDRKVSSVKLGDIRMIPYILLQLICIWFDGLSVGKSKCETYSNTIELALQRGLNKKNAPTLPTGNAERNFTVPECTRHNALCNRYMNLLLKLGKLSFYALFQKIKESSLVIDSTTVLKFLTEQELEFCLKIGLLSQSKDRSLVSVKRYQVYFQHKSIQEFMAALYITSEWNNGTIKSTILEVCSSLSSILEMENVFVFVCGMNPEVYTCISGELQTIVDLDRVTCTYRTYMYIDRDDAWKSMKSYQSMQLECLQESLRNGNDSCPIPLYFVLDKHSLTYDVKALKSIMQVNESIGESPQVSLNEKIVASMLSERPPFVFMQSLDPGVFTSLETLRVEDCGKEPVWLADILTESARTLKCLTLSGYISLSAISITALTGLTCLQSLYLDGVNMTHSNLKCLYDYITQTTTLTQLKLEYIHCSDHRGQYRDCDVTLDLHRLNELKILDLVRVPCIELHVNTTCLEKLEFWPLLLGEKMTARASVTLWQDLRAAPVLSSLTLWVMSSCQEMIQTIPTLTQLQHLELGGIDMDDVIPRVSPDMTHLEHVVLQYVKMSSAAWREFLLSVGQLQHPVILKLKWCLGSSRKEWGTFMEEIKSTPTLSWIQDLHLSFDENKLPLEILRMDQTAIDQYKTALATGQEKVYNIRVMIVGHCGVGKTVLTKRLLNQDVEIDTRVPTEGIDIHVGKMTVNLLNGEWTAHTDNTRQKFAERKKRILDHYTDENKESAETSSEDISESSIEETSDYSHEVVIYERPNEPNSHLSSDHEQQQDGYDRPFSKVISESSHEVINERSNERSSEHKQQQDAYDRPSSPDLFTRDVQTRQRQPTEKEIKKNLQLNSRQLDNVCEHDKISLENENSRREEELREIQQLSDSDLNKAEVSIWDFAGQYAFYDTHQVFMSWRTIYLLVTDLSKQPTDIVENDDCYVDFTGRKQWNLSEFGNFWLNAIGKSSSVEGNNEGPPVILVGTFADKVQDNKGFERLEEFKRALTKNNLTASNLEKEHFVIDNFSKRDTFEDLRKTILEKAKTQQYWGESKPARWIDMEIKLHDMNINGIQILDKESLYTMNEKSRLLIPKQELELFLKYHHECGNLIHFSDDDTLNRTVVLEPRFLINAFKKLNPQREFFTKKSRALDNWVQYDKYGILPESLIYEMWGVAKNENENVQESVTDSVNLEVINTQDIDKSNYNKFAQAILLYLEKLGLLAKPIIKECKINELFYFAPSFLKETIPDRYLIPAKHEVTTSKLCFTTKSGYIQSAVFNKLLASCIAEYPVVYVNDRYMLFCGCGKFRFNNDNDTTLYVFFRENEIQIWLSNKNEPDKAVCKKAKEFVKEKIDKLRDIKYLVKSPQTHVLMDDEGFSVILDDDDDDRFKNLEPRSSRMTKPSRVEVDPEQLAECWFSNGKAKLEDQDANKVTENEYAREKRFNKNCIYNGRLIELTNDEKDKIVNYCGGKTTFAGLRKIQALKSEGFAVEVAIRRVSVDEKLKKDYVLRKINVSRFRHPFIAPTYTIFVKENVFYFISPYCKNGALESALHQPDPSHRTNECCCTLLSETNRIRIAFQVSSAILYLRENGVEHGGISSKNIVLDKDLNARLIDFKLSKDINDIASSPNSFRSPSAGEVDQANHDSKCDDTATCCVKDFADFRRVIYELMCYSFEDNCNEISVEAKQTIDDVVECLKYTTTVTDFKEKVVYKLKELLFKYTEEVIRGYGNQREQKCVVCNVCLINPAVANDIVRPCCCRQPMAACIACIYASSLRCFTCEAKVPTIGDNWGALLIAGKGIDREADEQSAVFQNDAKAIKDVLKSQAIGMREENVIEITSNDKAEFLPQLRTAVEKFTCKSNSECTDECYKVNIAPTTMFIYFSGHGNEDSRKNNVFVIGSNDLTREQLTEELQKMKHVDTFVIILDRCYPPFITMENKTVIQINASEPAEVSKLTMKGSIFTKYFIQAFTGKCPNSCKICDDFANNGNDYVTISDMHKYILDHFEKEYEKQKPCMNIQGPKRIPYIGYKARSTSECDIDGLLKTLDSIPLESGQTGTTVLRQ